MNLFRKIISTFLGCVLGIIFPFIVMTLITSKTSVLLGISSFVVLSGSMEPAFPVGSIVYAQKKSTYDAGEVITFKTTGDQNVTHRIYSVEKQNGDVSYITKGDANNNIDSIPVKQSQIVGKVFFFVPFLGKLVNLLKTPVYFLVLIIIPSMLFILAELIAIKNEIVRSTEKRMTERLRANVDIRGYE